MKTKKVVSDYPVTGLGVISSLGASVDEWFETIKNPKNLATASDYSMRNANIAKHLTDKRMLKAVSQRDGVGLAAIELLKKQIRFDSVKAEPYERGIFVGACPSTVDDNENYLEAVQRSSIESDSSGERLFGKYCMDARPTTLLLGLPNNVLCYGSILLEAKGPNDNYTSGEISALVGMHVALRNLRRDRIKLAFCGGYSSQTNLYSLEVVRGRGDLSPSYDKDKLDDGLAMIDGTVPADAACFASIESELREDRKELEIARLHGTALACSSSGPTEVSCRDSDALIILNMIERCLDDAGIASDDLDFVFISGSGITRIDRPEVDAVQFIQNKMDRQIPVLSLAPVTKNLFEASGIAEIGVANCMVRTDTIPSVLSMNKATEFDQVKPRRYFLIIRSSGFGEFASACLSVAGGGQ